MNREAIERDLQIAELKMQDFADLGAYCVGPSEEQKRQDREEVELVVADIKRLKGLLVKLGEESWSREELIDIPDSPPSPQEPANE